MQYIDCMDHFFTSRVHSNVALIMSSDVCENGTEAPRSDDSYLHAKSLGTTAEMIRGGLIGRVRPSSMAT